MKKFSLKLFTVFVILFYGNLSIAQITINGNAFLEHETNHQNIKIDLERTAPSSLTYTFYTDGNGYFTGSIETGVYNITYSKTGFYSVELIDEQLFSNSTLADTTLKVNLCGQLSDTIVTGDYKVSCNIEVANGDTLVIEPGVRLFFTEDIKFDINGLLIAEGTDQDSIIFTHYDPYLRWGGINFHNNTDDNSILSYCLIEWSISSGISCDTSNVTLTNLTIRDNIAQTADYHRGGGIYLNNSSPIIANVIVDNNNSYNSGPGGWIGGGAYGGGICCYNYSNPTITNVTISNNTSYQTGGGGGIACIFNSNPILHNVWITSNKAWDSSNDGGGIYCYGSSNPYISNTTIENNTSLNNGGGIFCGSTSSPSFSNSFIRGNSASQNGGGIYCSSSNPILTNLIIDNNTASNGGGIYCSSSPSLTNLIISNNTASNGGGIYFFGSYTNPILINLTIDNNSASNGGGVYCKNSSANLNLTNLIITNNDAFGLYCDNSTPNITYCNVWNNTTSNFYNCGTWVGQNVTTNANGNDCDMYYNIQEDPMFENAGSGDYHLHTGSPCIDVGINDSVTVQTDFDGNTRIWDGDNNGTAIVDMGAFEVGLNIGNDIAECGSAILTAGGGYSSYNWNNGLSSNDTLIVDTSGVYFVEVTNSLGLTSSDTINVTIYPLPNVNLGNDTTVCNNLVIETEQDYLSYDWNSGLSTNDSLNVDTSGVYYVYVTDSNNCSNYSDTINVTINPTFLFSSNDNICDGDSLLWHGNYLKNTGVYFDSLFSVNGCDSIYELNLTVNPTYYSSEYDTICNGDSVLWQGSYYDTTGQYFANYQTINSCDSIFELNLIVKPTYYYVEQDTICNGDSILWQGNYYDTAGQYFTNYQSIFSCDSVYELNLFVNPSYYYSDNQNICNGDSLLWHGNYLKNTGVYFDSLFSVNGCDSIYELNLEIITIDTSITQNGTTLSANAINATYQWLTCNLFDSIPGETSQVYTASANGNYAVIINQNGCIDTSSCYTITTVGLTDHLGSNNITISPNPTKGLVFITGIDINKIEVLNINGQIINEFDKNKSGNYKVNLSARSKGLYLIKIYANDEIIYKKIVFE